MIRPPDYKLLYRLLLLRAAIISVRVFVNFDLCIYLICLGFVCDTSAPEIKNKEEVV